VTLTAITKVVSKFICARRTLQQCHNSQYPYNHHNRLFGQKLGCDDSFDIFSIYSTQLVDKYCTYGTPKVASSWNRLELR
jgi:hypothetical protein